jgi:hypothetical protein
MIKNKFGFVAQSITSSDTLLSTNFKNIFHGAENGMQTQLDRVTMGQENHGAASKC